MDRLRYEILGPLRLAQVHGQPLRASKPRQLLATLLLHPNRFVSTDLIADALWEGTPPRSATANIRTYVRALRGVLQEAGLAAAIDTSAAGYSIGVGVDEPRREHVRVAARRGRPPARRGRQARGHARLVPRLLVVAWAPARRPDHPVCLGRLDRPPRRAVPGLVDTLLDLRLEYGDASGAAVLLSGRLTEDPYDEQLWRRLVDALLAAGRTGEARAAYQKAVQTLADELDVKPGPEPKQPVHAQRTDAQPTGQTQASPQQPVRRYALSPSPPAR